MSKSISAAAQKDYIKAFAFCDDIYDSGVVDLELASMLESHYSTLINDTRDYIFVLTDQRHFDIGLKLIHLILPKLESSEHELVKDSLNSLSTKCLDQLLFSRKSRRYYDVLLC